MGSNGYQIDNVDRGILEALLSDSRTPYTDIADTLHVSAGTIHVRVNKMRSHGIIEGSKVVLNPQALGYEVNTLVGVVLQTAADYPRVLAELKELKEITEIFYATGTYSVIIKILTRSVDEFRRFLVEKLQRVEGIHSTESFVILDTPLKRDIQP